MKTDPTLTHMNRKLVNVDDYATNGRPDTMKILPAVQKDLREALIAQEVAPTLERVSLISFLKDKVNQYAARARARKS